MSAASSARSSLRSSLLQAPPSSLPDDGASDAGGGDVDGDGEEDANGALLTRAVIRRGLADLQRTSNSGGDASGGGGAQYAFARLDLSGMGLETLEGDLGAYPSLRYVSVAANRLLDLSPLSALGGLHALDASRNQLASLDSLTSGGAAFPALQLLQLDANEIEYVVSSVGADRKRGVKASLSRALPALAALTLSNNRIASLARAEDLLSDLAPHPGLQLLDLSFNALASLDGVSLFPGLRVLSLAHNELVRLEGVQHLRQLEKLDVAHNRLANLSVELDRLAKLPKLTALSLSAGNAAFADELEAAAQAAAEAHPEGLYVAPDLTSEVLLLLPRLTLLDGRRVTAAMRRAADQLKKDRQAEAERRAAEEEEARKAAEEEERLRKAEEGEDDEDEDKEDDEEDEDEKQGEAHDSAHEADGAAADDAPDTEDLTADDDEPTADDDDGEEA